MTETGFNEQRRCQPIRQALSDGTLLRFQVRPNPGSVDPDQTRPMQQFLIILGITLLIAGLLWPWLSRLPFGRLPGDLSIQRENFSFHFPLMTSILVSIVLTLLLWLFRK